MAEKGSYSPIAKFYTLVANLLFYPQSLFLLIVRLYWGYHFYVAGRGKLLNLDRTAGFFANMNLPAPKFQAILVGSLECFGGWLLILGLGSRIISIPLAFTMVVAYLTAHKDSLQFVFAADNGEFLSQAPATYLLAMLIIATCGPGLFSIDALISKKFSGGNPEAKY